MKKIWYCAILGCLCFLMSWGGVASASKAVVENLRIGINQDKVRIVADTSGEVDYRSFVLSSPQRVVIDLTDATMGKNLKKEYNVASSYVDKVRVGQFDKNTVRIVIETKIKNQGYDVFGLPGSNGSYRVAMDFGQVSYSNSGQSAGKNTSTASSKPAEKVQKPEVKPVTPPKTTAPSVSVPAINFTITAADKAALSGKKITIDPGHGGSDSGAIGPSGVMEKNVALRVGISLANLLKESGARVFLTRRADNDVAPQPATDKEELQARVDVANNADTDIFVSIHLDSFTSPAAQGSSGWYYVNASNASKVLADSVKKHVVDQLGTVDRGTKSSNFYVIKYTSMPATLIELGFVSNPNEETLLNSDDGVKKAAVGIYQGLVDYFKSV